MATDTEVSFGASDKNEALYDETEKEEFDALNDETFGNAATFDEDWEEQHEKMAKFLSKEKPTDDEITTNVNQRTISGGYNVNNNSHSPSNQQPFAHELSKQFMQHVPETIPIHTLNNLNTSPVPLPPGFSSPSIWNSESITHKTADMDNTTPSMAPRTRRMDHFDELSANRTIIKRPMKLDELEAMLLSPESDRKTLASLENSQTNTTDTRTNSVSSSEKDNNVAHNSGWSPFCTGMDNFIPNIRLGNPENSKADENSMPSNQIGKNHSITVNVNIDNGGAQAAVVSPPSIGTIGGHMVKQPIFLDDLERLILSENDLEKQESPKNLGSNINQMLPSARASKDTPSNQIQINDNLGSIVSLKNIPISSTLATPQSLMRIPYPQPIAPAMLRPLLFPGNAPVNPLTVIQNNFGNFNPSMVVRNRFAPVIGVRPVLFGNIPTSFLQQHFLNNQPNHNFHRRPYNNNTNNFGRPNFYETRRGPVDFDEFAGLMSQKDKAWLITIQKRQLNFDDPYKEDFYYTSYSTRKLAAAAKAKRGESERKDLPALIVPERYRGDKSLIKEYVPAHFEGSLGKLQVSNVNCPRKLLDLDAKQSEEVKGSLNSERPVTPIGRAELNAFRRLLVEIERLYFILLDIDEEDKRMGALPENAKKPHQERRDELCLKLYKGVYDEKHKTINSKIASIRKGFSLIIRSLLALSENCQKEAIVKAIFDSHLNSLVSQKVKPRPTQLDYLSIVVDTISDLKSSTLPTPDEFEKKVMEMVSNRSSQTK